MNLLGRSDSSYTVLVYLFLELRAKGMSLSSVDLDILKAWEEAEIKPEFIIQIMLDYAEECKLKSKKFPSTLLPISRKVRSILVKTGEF